MNINLKISEKVSKLVPDLQILQIEANVVNLPTSDELWDLLKKESGLIASSLELSEINKIKSIKATRDAYKLMGKDPNRYRPSSEALMRRCVKGLGLYRLTSIVDIINLISLRTGYSIGGFDIDKIKGTVLTLGIGEENEPYEGIGRGVLNISGMPVWRDDLSGIGTPTSDIERTKLTEQTTKVLIIVNMYGSGNNYESIGNNFVDLLEKFANATDVKIKLINI